MIRKQISVPRACAEWPLAGPALILLAIAILLLVACDKATQSPPAAANQTRSTNATPADLAQLLAKARAGDPAAQVELGLRYSATNGLAGGLPEALKWYHKAASQGSPQAKYLLGSGYFFSESDVSGEQARLLLQEACASGYNDALFFLGLIHDSRVSIQGLTNAPGADAKTAFACYEKAANAGHLLAQTRLAACYQNGYGTTQDPAQAAHWFRIAAEQGHADSAYELGLCYYSGNSLPKDYAQAVSWFRRAGEATNAPSSKAQYALGYAYYVGIGVPQDYSQSFSWLHLAAEAGYDRAQADLGMLYLNGEGTSVDLIEAYKWLNLATAQDIAHSSKRDRCAARMSPEEIAEAQLRSSAFMASKNHDQYVTTPAVNTHRRSPTARGTGFFITDDGYFLTCAHVVTSGRHVSTQSNSGTPQIRVTTGSGEFPARLVAMDLANDIALLKAVGSFKALSIAPSRTARLGERVSTFGFPNTVIQGLEPKFTTGEINGLAGIQDDPRHFQISIPVQPGNSGGPLLDPNGNVLGIVTGRLEEVTTLKLTGSLPQNVNYALKSSFITAFLDTLPDSPQLPKPNATKTRGLTRIASEAKNSVARVTVY